MLFRANFCFYRKIVLKNAERLIFNRLYSTTISENPEIEREANRLLKTVSAFDKSTKTSLKVYHLQEIGKISDEFNQLKTDDRVKRLISQINADLHILSPAQLVAVALGYRNIGFSRKGYWNKLFYEVYRHTKSHTSTITGINRGQVAMILACYSTLSTDQLKQANELLRWITFSVGELNEYDYASVTYYMYRTRMGNENNGDFSMKCLKSITMGYLEKMHLFTPKSLVCVCHNYSRMQLLPWHLIFRTNNLLKPKVSALTYKSLAVHLRTLMNVKFRDLGLLNKISKRLLKDKRLPWAGSFELSTIVYTLGKLGYRNKALLERLIEISEKCILVMSEADLMRTVHGFSNLGVAHANLWHNVSRVLLQKDFTNSPQHLSIVAAAFGKVGVFYPELFDLIKHKFQDLANGFASLQAISLLDSAVILAYYDELFVSKALECYLSFHGDVPDFVDSQLTRIATSLLLEFPEVLKSATKPVEAFILNHSQREIGAVSDEKLAQLENFKSLVVESDQRFGDLEANGSVGPYKVHFTLDRIAVDFVSRGNLCPIGNTLLGPQLMKKRQIESLGFVYRIIDRSAWNLLSNKDKIESFISTLNS